MKKEWVKLISSMALTLAVIASAAATTHYSRKYDHSVERSRAIEAKVREGGNKPSRDRVHVLPQCQGEGASLFRCAVKKANATSLGKQKRGRHQSASALPNLIGMLTYKQGKDPNSSSWKGLYSICSDGTTELVAQGPTGTAGVPVGDLYWTSKFTEFIGLYFINTAAYNLEDGSWVTGFSSDEYNNIIFDFATDPTTNTVYSIGYNDEMSSMQLGTVTFDLSTGLTVTQVADLEGDWNSLACTSDGQLYGINYEGEYSDEDYIVTKSNLCKIDKNTGDVTLVGETGQIPQYRTSATIDPRSGKMYWTVSTSRTESFLCEVDLATGAATKILDLDGAAEIQGLFVKAPEAEDKAPAAVENLTTEFEGGALSGIICFTSPSTTFDGESATGPLDYKIVVDGETVATGTTEYGADESVSVTVPSPGDYTFIVTVSNNVGVSPESKIKLYVGFGVPKATTPELVYEDGEMKLTWEPVTETVAGGFLDLDAITYKVTRFPDESVVYDGHDSSYSESMALPEIFTRYYYTVQVNADGMSSEVASSNIVTLGSIEPPYLNTFDSRTELAGFTIINANDDRDTWDYYNGTVRARYNYSNNMDDWLITPPLKLKANMMYKVSFKSWGNEYAEERIEAKWGALPTVEGMTETLIDPTEVGEEHQVLENYICPPADGIYYVGLHGISDPDLYYLYVDDLEVSAGMPAVLPAMVGDLKAVPSPDGLYKATISFTVPDKSMNGEELTSLTKVEVMRDNVLIKTFTDPVPGEVISFIDEMEEGGTVNYTVTPFNYAGAGESANAVCFLGIDKPAAPQNISLTEIGNSGMVTISWDEVNTYENGFAVNPDLVKYIVSKLDGDQFSPVSELLTSTTFTYQAVPEGQQDFVQFAVAAVTDGGDNTSFTKMVAAGKPYESIEESFGNGMLHYIWGTGYSTQDAYWSVYTNELSIPSCDDDNGYAGMKGTVAGATSALFTGKVTLGLSNPGIRFSTYNIQGEDGAPDTNEIQIYVTEAGQDNWIKVGSPIVINDLNPDQVGWQQAMVDLNSFAGKTVQVRFQATVNSYIYVLVDQINIGQLLLNDMTLKNLTAPAKVPVGEMFNIDVTVTNLGATEAQNASVVLLKDGAEVASRSLPALASGVSTSVAFEQMMSEIAVSPVSYQAKVVIEGDEDTSNDESEIVKITPVQSDLPGPTDLTASASDDGVTLHWCAPDIEGQIILPEVVDFEGGQSWAHEYEGWKFVDVDGKPVGGFTDMDIPGINVGITTSSFFIFDSSEDGFNETFAGHSGDKYLASLFRFDTKQVDDWAISPELPGNAQTISFYARSFSYEYPEKIEMYYSMGGTDPADFIQVGSSVDAVPQAWTEYSFDVPEGAKYFAVRSCGSDTFVLMMDDFKFAAANGNQVELKLIGYDIYRDGVRINADHVQGTEYVDATVDDDTDYSYIVQAVYSDGISKPSDVASVRTLGVEGLSIKGMKIYSRGGEICIDGASGQTVSVFATDGTTICSDIASDMERVAVSTGIYIVRVGKKTVKIVV